MAIACNFFENENFGEVMNVSACKAPHLANLSDHELLPEQFMIAVMWFLYEASKLPMSNVPDLADGNPCDFAQVLQNASCAFLTNTPQFPTTPAEMQAQILWMMNEALCAITSP